MQHGLPFYKQITCHRHAKEKAKTYIRGGSKVCKNKGLILINRHIAYYAKENRQTTYTGYLHQGWLSEPTRKSRVELEIRAANKK